MLRGLREVLRQIGQLLIALDLAALLLLFNPQTGPIQALPEV